MQVPGPRWNPFEAALALTYDSAHVLPHVADSIVVAGRHVTIGYLGANPVLREMIERLVRGLSHDVPLRALYAADSQGLAEIAEAADLFIVDLGLDATLEPKLDAGGFEGEVPELPESLRAVAVAFERLVERERARLAHGMHPRRFVLVNSTTVYLDTFVVENLYSSGTATHSRVRRATVKPAPTTSVSLLRDVRWADRLKGPIEPLKLRVGKRAQFEDLKSFRGFGQGWWLPDPSGVWTRGSRAVLAVTCNGIVGRADPVLELTFDRVGVRRGRRVRFALAVDGAEVDSRIMTGGTRGTVRWRAKLPRHALEKPRFDLAIKVHGDREWADKNQLGLHVRAVEIASGVFPLQVREWLDKVRTALAVAAGRGRRVPSRLTSRRRGSSLRRLRASRH
jgi:hypothetical protein